MSRGLQLLRQYATRILISQNDLTDQTYRSMFHFTSFFIQVNLEITDNKEVKQILPMLETNKKQNSIKNLTDLAMKGSKMSRQRKGKYRNNNKN